MSSETNEQTAPYPSDLRAALIEAGIITPEELRTEPCIDAPTLRLDSKGRREAAKNCAAGRPRERRRTAEHDHDFRNKESHNAQ